MTDSFTFLGQTFALEKNEETWQLTIKRSDVNLANLDQLQLLEVASPVFLPQSQTYADEEEQITFTYSIPSLGKSFEAVKEEPFSERLRFCLNVLALKEALSYSFGFILHPDNLFVTKDLSLKIAYRGLLGVMTPTEMTEVDFQRQCQALIVSLFTDQDFITLYAGGLEVLNLPAFLEPVRQADSLASLESYLEDLYQEKLTQESGTLSLVSKRRYKIYKYVTVWLTAGLVILCVPLIYLVFFRGPFQSKMLDADKAFLKVDYNAVIDELDSISLSDLPYTQKYELAYAYVQGLDLNDEQEDVVLNNVTLKSDELYLDYWIQIGRGDSEDAVDTAKRLDDVDLILYGLAEAIKATREDDSLSGSDRDSKLSELQSDYDQYWDNRESSLAGDDKSSTSSSSSSQ